MGKKQKILFVLGLVLLAIFIFVSINFFMKTKLIGDESSKIDPHIIRLDTITTNVQGGVYHYLKTQIHLHVPNEQNKISLEAYLPQVRRTIIALATMQDGRSLLDQTGKEEFKNQIRHQLERQYGIIISNVYFNKFILAD